MAYTDKNRLDEIRIEIANIRELNRAYKAAARVTATERFAYVARNLRLQELKAELISMMAEPRACDRETKRKQPSTVLTSR